jgi:hypothetical protein
MKPDTHALHVGVAAVNIDNGPSGKADDPVGAKAIVFRQGEEAAALVVCDVINVVGEKSVRGRELAALQSGIPFDNICVSATHTHRFTTPPDDLPDRIASAVVQAGAAAVEVHLQVGKAFRDDLTFNRRFLMTDGMVMMNPGFLNPYIVRPVGPIDPEIGMVSFQRISDSVPFAALTTFSNHCDCLAPYDRRAEFPYWLERSLRQEFGQGFISVFGVGCSEDINSADVSRPGRYGPGPQSASMMVAYTARETTASPSTLNAQTVGEALGETVRSHLPQLETERPCLSVRSQIVDCPLATYSEMDLAWAREAAKREDNSFLTGYRARRILDLEGLRHRYGEYLPIQIQAIRLSEGTALVTLPGEVFVEHGLAIKHASPFANTFVIELSNDREKIASIPLRKSFCEGGYEIIYSRLECGSGEMLVAAALGMLRQLRVTNIHMPEPTSHVCMPQSR